MYVFVFASAIDNPQSTKSVSLAACMRSYTFIRPFMFAPPIFVCLHSRSARRFVRYVHVRILEIRISASTSMQVALREPFTPTFCIALHCIALVYVRLPAATWNSSSRDTSYPRCHGDDVSMHRSHNLELQYKILLETAVQPRKSLQKRRANSTIGKVMTIMQRIEGSLNVDQSAQASIADHL